MGKVERVHHGELVLHEIRDGAVTAAFTERTGGVSKTPFESLNLGTHVGDDPAAVQENRRRVLAALDAEDALPQLLVPNQVHGDHVACVCTGSQTELEEVRQEIAQGADVLVCCAPNIPIMLCYADCVPVILTAPAGFAVIHSGWKGTYARISAKAAHVLCELTGCAVASIQAYIGPHIQAPAYEVSPELMQKFDAEFGWNEAQCTRKLDMTRAITQTLHEVGVPQDNIYDTALCTVADNARFFSYRAEQGICGRHGAVAILNA